MSGVQADAVRSTGDAGAAVQPRAGDPHRTARATTAFAEALSAAADHGSDAARGDATRSDALTRGSAGADVESSTSEAGSDRARDTHAPEGAAAHETKTAGDVTPRVEGDAAAQGPRKLPRSPNETAQPVIAGAALAVPPPAPATRTDPASGGRSAPQAVGAVTTGVAARETQLVGAAETGGRTDARRLASPAGEGQRSDTSAAGSASAADSTPGASTEVTAATSSVRATALRAQRAVTAGPSSSTTAQDTRTARTATTAQDTRTARTSTSNQDTTARTATANQDTTTTGSSTPTSAPAGPALPAAAAAAADLGPGTASGAVPPRAAPATPVPGVAGQLVDVLSAPRALSGSTYTVSVALHPPALGQLEATVTLRAGDLTIHLAPSTPEGAAALRTALPELHAALASADRRVSILVATDRSGASSGRSGSSSNGSPEGQQATGERDQPAGEPQPSSATPRRSLQEGVAAVSAPPTDTTHLVDVRV